MTDLFEIIENLEQLKSMLNHGELTPADIDHFIIKYQSQAEAFEDDMWENVPV